MPDSKPRAVRKRKWKWPLAYTLHRSQKDPSLFLLYEKYKDKDALSYHSSTPYFKELFNVVGPLLDGTPGIEMYDEIARIKMPL